MDDKTLLDLFGSLSGEMAALRQEVKDGFDRVETRLSRQGGIIQGGARQVARLITWSEEMDALMAERDERIAELTRRIERLEGRAPAA